MHYSPKAQNLMHYLRGTIRSPMHEELHILAIYQDNSNASNYSLAKNHISL